MQTNIEIKIGKPIEYVFIQEIVCVETFSLAQHLLRGVTEKYTIYEVRKSKENQTNSNKVFSVATYIFFWMVVSTHFFFFVKSIFHANIWS